MAVVDQLIMETKAFHEAPPQEATVLMQHILSLKGDVTWTRCRDKGNRAIRGMQAADFAAAVKALVDAGQGTVLEGRSSLVFRAIRNDTG